MKKTLRNVLLVAISLFMLSACFTGCAKKEKIIIFTSMEDYRIEYMQQKLNEKFPDYDVVLEYKSSGTHAASIKAAGTNVDCHITYNLEYLYAQEFAELGYLADLKDISDFSVFTDDMVESTYYLPQEKISGAVVVNTEVLSKKGLSAPTSYKELLDPKYKDLISMPNPAASGTGYVFLLQLANAWGDDVAFDYFDQLAENVLSFASSGSGPINSLVNGEVAIGLGMTSQAVFKIKEGAPLQILEFEEGVPYAKYAQGIIAGNEDNPAVLEVFEYLSTELTMDNHKLYFPETIYKDVTATVEHYPTNINNSIMTDYNYTRKDELLKRWKY